MLKIQKMYQRLVEFLGQSLQVLQIGKRATLYGGLVVTVERNIVGLLETVGYLVCQLEETPIHY